MNRRANPTMTAVATPAALPAPPPRRPARWLHVAVAAPVALLLVAAAGRWAEQREAGVQMDGLRRTLETQSLALRATATQFEALPSVIARQQEVLAVLAAPQDEKARDQANRYLDDVASRARLSALYVMDRQGRTLAASNWRTASSFVGQNYGQRPYFVEARNGGTGRFYGIGLTSGVPGYFIAAPVRVPSQAVGGVVAVKVSLEAIERSWALARDPILLSDSLGIVFLGNVPSWQYRATQTLSAPDLERLRGQQQYGARDDFERLPWSSALATDGGGRQMQATLDGRSRRFLTLDESLPEFGWTLTVSADHAAVVRARSTAWALSALAIVALLLGALAWRQRERLLVEQRRAREALEQRVRERTRELEDARGFWQAMEDSLLVGLRARDLGGRIIYANPALCEMLGYAAGELVGCRPPYPFWHPDELDKHWRDNDAVVTGRASLNGFESRVRHRDGHDVYTMVYTAPLVDASGQQSGWMSSVVDITAQRRLEEQQRSQQAQLQRATRALSLGEMASTLAHELNQPLMALSNYAAAARALATQGPSALLVASLDDVAAQAQRAGEIVARIRGFVRQRSGQLEDCQLGAIVDAVLALVEPERRARRARLVTDIAPRLPTVRGDRVLLEQVLLNLVLNALQAMQSTPVATRIVRIEAEAVECTLNVRVADRGPGIDAAAAAQMFEPFFTRKTDGLGLGLSICRTIVESHGGRLGHQNRTDGGAIVYFTLRLPPCNEAS